MSNEVLTYISDETQSLFEEFNEDYLADVLRVWDCYAQEWFDAFITVFRFESDDLLVWNESGALKARKGSVLTDRFDKEAFPFSIEDADILDCLSWNLDESYGEHIGRAAISAALLESFV